MKKALVLGGSNGIGLAVALELAKKCDYVDIIDIKSPASDVPSNIRFEKHNLITSDLKFLAKYQDVDTVFYSAGFGRVAPFETFDPKEIQNTFQLNTIVPELVLLSFFKKMLAREPFNCGMMVSIAGHVSSPLFSLYGSTKAALRSIIESLNIELEKAGTGNRILDISPGSLKGTCFNGGNVTDLSLLSPLAKEIVSHMEGRQTLFIPEYETVFKGVLERYQHDTRTFGLQSYEYKTAGGKINTKPRVTIGYLSGTFDLFHVGHLNLLRNAKAECDYLVVGIHKDASHKGKTTYIPFEERMEIVRNCKYVDEVIESEKEDSDIYFKNILKYDKLFVGSDYKGTPRFNRYESLFAPLGVKIVYFPYTQGTSSTQLRAAIGK